MKANRLSAYRHQTGRRTNVHAGSPELLELLRSVDLGSNGGNDGSLHKYKQSSQSTQREQGEHDLGRMPQRNADRNIDRVRTFLNDRSSSLKSLNLLCWTQNISRKTRQSGDQRRGYGTRDEDSVTHEVLRDESHSRVETVCCKKARGEDGRGCGHERRGEKK